MHGLGRGHKNRSRRHGKKPLNRKTRAQTGKTGAEKTKPGVAKGETGLKGASSLAVLLKRPQAEQIGAGQV
jgi:hypothetical protein